MKNAYLKYNDDDFDVLIDLETAKHIHVGDVLKVYDFQTKEKPEWVLEFIGERNEDGETEAEKDVFPVDQDYRDTNGSLALKVTERIFNGDTLELWVDVSGYYD